MIHPVVLPRRPAPEPCTGDGRLRLFPGSANLALVERIAHYLRLAPGQVVRKHFANGELYVQIQESIRGCDVYLVQPTCSPVNEHLMELLLLIDACRRASARQITAVIPYYGYARADRKAAGRESITAKLVANLITAAGVDRVLTMNLHSDQIQGYFDLPIDHLYSTPVFLEYFRSRPRLDPVVVSPDVGGVARARAFAKKLDDAPLAIVDKRRPGHNQAEVMNVIGEVEGRNAILFDDMIDTAGTIWTAGQLLLSQGATAVYACATHAVFSEPACGRLADGTFAEVIVTDTIPIPAERQFAQLRTLSVADLLGEAIRRIHEDSSVSSLFR
jgi:ribose-phosphate pyrophosphokinase